MARRTDASLGSARSPAQPQRACSPEACGSRTASGKELLGSSLPGRLNEAEHPPPLSPEGHVSPENAAAAPPGRRTQPGGSGHVRAPDLLQQKAGTRPNSRALWAPANFSYSHLQGWRGATATTSQPHGLLRRHHRQKTRPHHWARICGEALGRTPSPPAAPMVPMGSAPRTGLAGRAPGGSASSRPPCNPASRGARAGHAIGPTSVRRGCHPGPE